MDSNLSIQSVALSFARWARHSLVPCCSISIRSSGSLSKSRWYMKPSICLQCETDTEDILGMRYLPMCDNRRYSTRSGACLILRGTQTARRDCALCTHAGCTLHAHIVHGARTHRAHCTHAWCTLQARMVHTASRHCAHCTHALCTLHARTHAPCTLHTGIVQAPCPHRAHCTHALCTLHARISHAARMHCAHCTVFWQHPRIYLFFVGHTWEPSLLGIRSGLLHGGLLDLKTNPTPLGEHGDRGL